MFKPIDPGKYVVFKRSDWNEFAEQVRQIHHADELAFELAEKGLTEAVVIRLKDVFAEGALNSYSSAVLTTIDVLRMAPDANVSLLEHLRDLADYFAGCAEKAHKLSKKVPD